MVNFAFGTRLKTSELEPIFTAIGDDWIRISGLCWILWTDKPAVHIYTLLERSLDQTDQILITRFDPGTISGGDTFGNLSPWIWDWLKSKMANMFHTGPDVSKLRLLPHSAFKKDEGE